LSSLGEVWGPTKKQDKFIFSKNNTYTNIDLDYLRTILPIKKLFFPQTQELFSFNLSEGNKKEIQAADVKKDRILFGLHPCEINAINIQDDFFMFGDYADPYYEDLRNNTIIVGYSCLPDNNCFCNFTGTGDVDEGYDLFINNMSEYYLVFVNSITGHDIVDNNKEIFDEDVSKIDLNNYKKWVNKRNSMFKHQYGDITNNITKLMELNHYDEFWDKLGEECLSCGTCTTSCPTCSCYNVVDKLSVGNIGLGNRERDWDSCQLPQFSVVAGNHDFRETRASRLKLYYSHKLVSYGNNGPSCVGCGRCIEQCPVDINVLRVVKHLKEVDL
jgi:sulfhydrogenase subunit beta (sulfur reductase)